MFQKLSVVNVRTNKKSWILSCLCIFLFMISIYTLDIGKSGAKQVTLKQESVPLLLNSGVTQTNEAEVTLVLWVENGKVPSEIYTQKPLPDWIWTNKIKETAQGDVAITLSGHKLININEERILFSWYNTMSEDMALKGVRIYFDERVPEAIDTSAFLSQINVVPAQWNLDGSLVSIAGYKSDLKASVLAGTDKINVQILCRSNSSKGQTALAMPALLEEF